MDLLTLMIVIIVVGVLLWLVNAYVPMEPRIKSILNAAVIIVLILWLLSAFGIIGALRRPIVP
jgi:hypothetical protein